MKIIKKTNLLYALLLFTAMFNTHKTHTMEPIEPRKLGWVALAGATILGGYVAYRQFLSYIHEEQEQPITYATQEPIEPFPFIELPEDVQNTIINLLTINVSAKTLKEAAQTINTLAQVNKELNTLINNPDFCLKIIKSLSQKFNCSDAQAAARLKTQEAQNRLSIQKKFSDMCLLYTFDEQKFNLLYEKYKEYVDLNFTSSFMLHDLGGNVITGTLLMQAASRDNCSVIQILLNYGADITKTNLNGNTALIIAVDLSHIKAIECLLNNPHIIIDQQNNYGYTALLIALFGGHTSIIKLLLNASADPEITNNNGLTPLQAAQQTGNQKIIDLIQNAIRKKYEKQGK